VLSFSTRPQFVGYIKNLGCTVFAKIVNELTITRNEVDEMKNTSSVYRAMILIQYNSVLKFS